MKKIIVSLLVIASLFMVLPANAQAKLGIKGGVDVTEFSLNTNVFNTSNRLGYFIGPTLKMNLPVVGLGLDISALYDRRDTKILGLSTAGDVTVKHEQIMVPVNLRYTIGLGSQFNIFGFAGPQVAFNLGDQTKTIPEQMIEWTLRSSNFSVNAGAGLTLGGHLQVSANYNIIVGKTGDITYQDVQESILTKKTSANSWQLALAYFF